ncbi:secA_DEAD domain-containing protein [Trichonephila inaurata madagascariensis]|uniref:SecA_DEAD domain-containing protein n=1 Tax=Trichonephila inaurata madagascariensis TaxID=2747483 RepID=A0A8X6JX94_9ARAC|nr:secA_DEAD domain-containing protein [Trichonephila inaurata madagascariensis]
MIQSIYGLPDQKILYLSDKDIQLFSYLTVLADSKHLEQLWYALLKKVQQANSKSLKDIGPLTNPIYLYLFKSLQELITEISNTAEIPKEDLLKVDSAGYYSVLGSIKWNKSPRTTCSIEQQYYFIFELMQHFEPGLYSYKERVKHEFRLLDDQPETSFRRLWQWIRNFCQ